ncbi:MAG TPA: cation:proton antiporter [Verrucomicrobiae bacterium]|nr:cation:proton antiporter [Verrucomicrobiae bacterium]
MHAISFLQDMAMVMAASAVIMVLCQQLRLPVVLGYILAGLLIGPHTPPYSLVHDIGSINTLSELGVIFLLFSIGLEFSIRRLAKVGLVAFVAATVEIILMIWIGFSAGRALGWKFMDSLFLGALLSISSTTIIAKVLMDMKKIKEKFAQVILGILVIEDILAIVIIALLSGIAATGTLEVKQAGIEVIRVASFILAVLFLGFWLAPRALRFIERFESNETLIVAILGFCFGVSLAAAKCGFSVALGAFLAGAILAETEHVKKIVHLMEPIRDMFTAVFFVSVGMLLDPKVMMEFRAPILALTLVTIAAKIMSCSAATFLAGYNVTTAFKVGLGLAQIGEFSFIIARLGEDRGVTSPFLFPIAVSISGITTLTTPFLMKNNEAAVRGLSRLAPKGLGDLLGFYTSWLERAGTGSERTGAVKRHVGAELPRIGLYVVGAFGMAYAVTRMHYAAWMPRNFYWPVLGVSILPFFMGFAYAVDRIFLNVAAAFGGGEAGGFPEAHQVLHNVFRFFIILTAGLVFLAVGSFFLPSFPLTIAVAGLVLLALLFLGDSVRRAHRRVEHVVLGVFGTETGRKEEEPQDTAAHDELARLIREEYPWEVATEDFLLPYRESALNQTIRDLRLRSETGASVVCVYRGAESIPNPPAETRLLPGDVLLLMGSPDQVRAAIGFLHAKVKEPPPRAPEKIGAPHTQAFEIPAGASSAGKTLRQIKLRRRTGISVLGLKKGNLSINNPDPETLLEAGDTLILFGWPEQIEAAQRCLAAAE